jgi:hypothetical protein
MKVLTAAPLAPLTPATVREVQSLFPEGTAFPQQGAAGPPVQVGREEDIGALRRFKVGTAPGRNWFRVRHFFNALSPPAHGCGSIVVEGLVGLVNAVLRGQVPEAIRPFFAGAMLLPFVKPDRSGIRPIACGWGWLSAAWCRRWQWRR